MRLVRFSLRQIFAYGSFKLLGFIWFSFSFGTFNVIPKSPIFDHLSLYNFSKMSKTGQVWNLCKFEEFFLLLGIFANRILASDIIFLCLENLNSPLQIARFWLFCVFVPFAKCPKMAVFATSEFPSIFIRVCGLSRRFLHRTNLRWLNVRYFRLAFVTILVLWNSPSKLAIFGHLL